MIHEAVMAQGSFDIPFSVQAPFSIWQRCIRYGHIMVFPQYVDPREFDDVGLKGLARYSGVVLERNISSEGMKISGASIHWHLGDDQGAGPIKEGKTTFSATAMDDVLDEVLENTGLVPGTVTLTDLDTYTSVHYFETPVDILRTACLSSGAEYRVNPDGTVDLATKAILFNTETPSVVISRRLWGQDPVFNTVQPVTDMDSSELSRDYVERIVVTANNINDVPTFVAALDRAGAGAFTNFAGDPLIRTFVGNMGISEPIDVATWAVSNLNQRNFTMTQEITTEHYEVTGGQFNIGDAVYAWDPPAFRDPTNPQYFRGEYIFPLQSRLWQADWPLKQGMGVVYRDIDGEYTDLTQYIAWEGESAMERTG